MSSKEQKKIRFFQMRFKCFKLIYVQQFYIRKLDQKMQLLLTVLFVLSASAMHLAMHEHHNILNFQNGQSYYDVCIAGYNRNYHWGFISIHDNHQLYHVGNCLANQRWNLHYQPDGTYCIQSNKQRGRYVSADTKWQLYGVRPQTIRDKCLPLEQWNLNNQGDSFTVSLPNRGYWTYHHGSTPVMGGISSIFYLQR